MTCHHCGQALEEGAVFCGFCGTACVPQEDAKQPVTSAETPADWQTYDVFEEARKSSSKKRTVLLAIGWVWFGLAVAAWIALGVLLMLGILPPS